MLTTLWRTLSHFNWRFPEKVLEPEEHSKASSNDGPEKVSIVVVCREFASFPPQSSPSCHKSGFSCRSGERQKNVVKLEGNNDNKPLAGSFITRKVASSQGEILIFNLPEGFFVESSSRRMKTFLRLNIYSRHFC
jgi:hypothetical protein